MIADYSFFHKIFCSEPVDAFQTAKQSVQLESIKSKGKLAKNIFLHPKSEKLGTKSKS